MKTPEQACSIPHFSQLSTYEDWATQNWIHQPGTDDAQLHARAKLDEECVELVEALETANAEDIVSEAGDVLWTATASGSNAGISISQALSYSLPAVFNGDFISTHSIDELAMEILQDTSIEHSQAHLQECASTIGKYAKQWFRLQHITHEAPGTWYAALTHNKRHFATIALADITLLTSYIAQEFAASSLEGVMNYNYQKIEQRIRAGVAATKSPRPLQSAIRHTNMHNVSL